MKLPSVRGLPWRNPLTIAGGVVLLVWTVITIFGPMVLDTDPLVQLADRFAPPSDSNWFGTDSLGRDVFTRVIYGGRTTLPLAVLLVIAAGTIGTLAGAVAGYFGGLVDSIIMRLADLFFSFPAIILAMAVVAALGPSLLNAVIALVFVVWPQYARVTRSVVLSVAKAEYIQASRLLGAPSHRVLMKDVAPNVGGPVAVLATLDLGNAVLLLSGLSFLGLGVQPPTPEWGAMVAEGARSFSRWWIALFPGLAIVSIVLGSNLVGDSLRDALDPRAVREMR